MRCGRPLVLLRVRLVDRPTEDLIEHKRVELVTFVTFAVEVRASRIDWLIVGGRDIFGSRLNLVFDVFSDVPVPARERLVDRFDGCFVIFGFLKLYKKAQDGLIYLPRGCGAIF